MELLSMLLPLLFTNKLHTTDHTTCNKEKIMKILEFAAGRHLNLTC